MTPTFSFVYTGRFCPQTTLYFLPACRPSVSYSARWHLHTVLVRRPQLLPARRPPPFLYRQPARTFASGPPTAALYTGPQAVRLLSPRSADRLTRPAGRGLTVPTTGALVFPSVLTVTSHRSTGSTLTLCPLAIRHLQHSLLCPYVSCTFK